MWKKLIRAVKPFVFPLLILAILAAGFAFRKPIAGLLGDRGRLKAWVAGSGAWAPVVFFGLQVIQVVIFVLPGEIVQVAGGDEPRMKLTQPFGVDFAADGTMYVVEMVKGERLRKISGDHLTTLAGTGQKGGDGDDGRPIRAYHIMEIAI